MHVDIHVGGATGYTRHDISYRGVVGRCDILSDSTLQMGLNRFGIYMFWDELSGCPLYANVVPLPYRCGTIGHVYLDMILTHGCKYREREPLYLHV